MNPETLLALLGEIASLNQLLDAFSFNPMTGERLVGRSAYHETRRRLASVERTLRASLAVEERHETPA